MTKYIISLLSDTKNVRVAEWSKAPATIINHFKKKIKKNHNRYIKIAKMETGLRKKARVRIPLLTEFFFTTNETRDFEGLNGCRFKNVWWNLHDFQDG